jgi:RNA-dependent RNA polymerase
LHHAVDGFEDYINDAFDYKSKYDSKLGNLMDYYGIEREAEILDGNVLKKSKYFDKKRDMDVDAID